MVFEQMLTILLGTGAGVAVVLYTVKPRSNATSQSPVSEVSAVETISLPSRSSNDVQIDSTPAPAAATQSAVVETPAPEVHAIPSGPVSTMSAQPADTTTPGTSDVPSGGFAAESAVAHTATGPFSASRPSSGARSHRAPRRSSATPRTSVKPRASGPERTPRKRLD